MCDAHFIVRRIILIAGTLILTATNAFAQTAHVLRVEDALGVLAIPVQSPIGLSPDGEWVAYTVQDARKRESAGEVRYSVYKKTGAFVEAVGCDIWITNTKTSESENLTRGNGTSWSPVWSPDGKHLAFYSDRGGVARLWLWDRAARTLRQATDAIVRPFFNSEVVRWSADSRRVLFKALPENMTLEQATDLAYGPATRPAVDKETHNSGVTAKVYSFIPGETGPQPSSTDPNVLNHYLSDLAVVDVASGQLTRIARKKRPLGYWFSPDGRFVAYSHLKEVQENTQQIIYELSMVSLADGQSRILVHNLTQEDGGSVSWSPDGKQLAYLTSGPKTKGECFVIGLEGGEPRKLSGEKLPSLGDPYGGESHAPQWDAEGKNLFLFSPPHYKQTGAGQIWKVAVAEGSISEAASIPDHVILSIAGPVTGGRVSGTHDGNSIIAIAEHTGTKQVGFYRIDLKTGTATKIFERDMAIREPVLRMDVAREKIVYVSEDVGHPEDIWLLEGDYRVPRRISKINSALEGVSMGSSRIVTWRGLEGEELRGALLLPANYKNGERFPLIVNVYGGSNRSDEVNRFGFGSVGAENLQILATRGYAVLLPDAPLASGTPMQQLAKTVLPGVSRVVELGIADPNRLGIMGHSYGGYSTLSLIVQTKAFKAAVDSAGVSNLFAEYTSMNKTGQSFGIGWVEGGQGGMLGHPWQQRDAYIENSPFFYLDRVETPLLIIHGELDEAVPVSQGEAVFVSLRRLGKKVVFVKYEGEGHWEGEWSPQNVVDYWNRVTTWFDEQLK
jgi:dipeptidyl aminopeptidase/acylaminoacyl peptidase